MAEPIEEAHPPWFSQPRIPLPAPVLAAATLFDIRPKMGPPESAGPQPAALLAINKLTN